jgi:hypothetical protein
VNINKVDLTDNENTAMHETESNDSWRALAEELGLATDAEGQSASPVMAHGHEPAAAEGVKTVAEPGELPPSTEEVPSGRNRRRTKRSDADRVKGPEPQQESVNVPEDAAETSEAAGTEERTRRRRRRRGSKRTSSREKEATTEDATLAEAPGHSTETEEETSAEQPRRRRRRRGKKVEREMQPEPADDMEEEPEESTSESAISEEEVEDADEENEDFSTWNVPSWAEIIAGLYRPER